MRRLSGTALGIAVCAAAALAAGALEEGNALFRRGQYLEAVRRYDAVAEEDPNRAAAIFNAGVARYMLGDFDTAAALFKASAERGLVFAGNYNRGNAHYRGGKFRDAAEAYKAALRVTPSDTAAKHNLLLALARISRDEKKDSQPRQEPEPSGGAGSSQSQPQGGAGGMDREMAERILQGLGDADAQTQKDMRRERRAVEVQVEKDW